MLKLTNLNQTFNKNSSQATQALINLNLTIKPGEFVTVVGSNGAGKSTLLASIAGTFLADSGQIKLDDQNLTQLADFQRASLISRVFQDPFQGTVAEMTIEENLALAWRRGKKRSLKLSLGKSRQQFFRSQLAQLNLGLENRLKQRVGCLSGGQRQALSLIMATLVKPQILLLDEHTAALDPKTAALILDLTAQIVQKNKLTALMITHNLNDALNFGNRLIMMTEGQIVLDVRGRAKARLKPDNLLTLI